MDIIKKYNTFELVYTDPSDINCSFKYGMVGQFAFNFDNIDYYVGDIVGFYYLGVYKESVVVKNDKASFFMGFYSANFNRKACSKLSIKEKIKNYYDLRCGDIVHDNMRVCRILTRRIK